MGRLDQYNDGYKAATGKDRYANLPDGTYDFYIKDAYASVTKTTNRDVFKWDLCVNAPPEFHGRYAWKSDYFDKPEALDSLKASLKVLGHGEDLAPGDLDNPAKVKQLIGLRVQAKVKQGKNLDFPPYVTFRKLLEGTGPVDSPDGIPVGAGREPGADADAGSALGEDAPF